MKRLAAVLLILIILFSFTGCHRISLNSKANATLNFHMYDTDVTQTLTEEETRKVKEYLTSAVYNPGIGGCPYYDEVNISFGKEVFLVACDDCGTVWYLRHGYYELSEEGRSYIRSLFKAYVGFFPHPIK